MENISNKYVNKIIRYTSGHLENEIKEASKLFDGCKNVGEVRSRFSLDTLLHRGYGFSTFEAKEPEIYTGSYNRNVGKSTEFGDIGGGFIRGTIQQPLSTAGIHDCVAINLVDEKSGKQALYHVYAKTSQDNIAKAINENFPQYTGINIIPGDNFKTTKTTKNILDALKSINDKTPVKFYFLPSKNAEIVACDGELKTIYHQGSPKPTFNIDETCMY